MLVFRSGKLLIPRIGQVIPIISNRPARSSQSSGFSSRYRAGCALQSADCAIDASVKVQISAADSPDMMQSFMWFGQLVAGVLRMISALWLIGGGILLLLGALARDEYNPERERWDYRH